MDNLRAASWQEWHDALGGVEVNTATPGHRSDLTGVVEQFFRGPEEQTRLSDFVGIPRRAPARSPSSPLSTSPVRPTRRTSIGPSSNLDSPPVSPTPNRVRFVSKVCDSSRSPTHSPSRPESAAPLPSSDNSNINPQYVPITHQAEANAESDHSDQNDQRDEREQKRVRRWFPLQEVDGVERQQWREVWVQQLPKPSTEMEVEEQMEEWSTREYYSEEEAETVYRALIEKNKELLYHHHEFPSLEIFKLHLPHLPKWLVDGEQPCWRSPVDRAVSEAPDFKIYRYIYYWFFELPIGEAKDLLEELNKEKWAEEADRIGCRVSFTLMRVATESVIEKAEQENDEFVELFSYVGMGAKSGHQVNDSCRAFQHLGPGHPSLFRLSIAVVRAYQSQHGDSDSTLVQSFVSHLPLNKFPYSGHVFMYAETLFAIALGAAPVVGGTNVVSCGPVDFFRALIQHLDRSSLNDSDPIEKLIDTKPISTASTVFETMEEARRRRELINEAETNMRRSEQERFKSLADSSNLRSARPSHKPATLPSATIPSIPTSTALPSSSTSAASTSRRSSSQTSESTSALSVPQIKEASTKSAHIKRILREYKLTRASSSDLDDIVRDLPNFSTTNISDLFVALEPYHNQLDIKRPAVAQLLFRIQNPGSAGQRTFDNFLSLAILSSTGGSRIRCNINPTNGKSANTANIVGIGVHAGTREIINFNVTCRTNSPVGFAEWVLKWSAMTNELTIFDSTGREPI